MLQNSDSYLPSRFRFNTSKWIRDYSIGHDREFHGYQKSACSHFNRGLKINTLCTHPSNKFQVPSMQDQQNIYPVSSELMFCPNTDKEHVVSEPEDKIYEQWRTRDVWHAKWDDIIMSHQTKWWTTKSQGRGKHFPSMLGNRIEWTGLSDQLDQGSTLLNGSKSNCQGSQQHSAMAFVVKKRCNKFSSRTRSTQDDFSLIIRQSTLVIKQFKNSVFGGMESVPDSISTHYRRLCVGCLCFLCAGFFFVLCVAFAWWRSMEEYARPVSSRPWALCAAASAGTLALLRFSRLLGAALLLASPAFPVISLPEWIFGNVRLAAVLLAGARSNVLAFPVLICFGLGGGSSNRLRLKWKK